MGRDSVFGENGDKIYGLQRSEILDDRICNYCLSIDGRVCEFNDPFTKMSQFHHRCRGIWVHIGTKEEVKPDITGIPQELRERVGTLNEFDQLKKPVPLPGSLADEFLKQSNNDNE
jgi:predicted transcriptional regulator